MIESATYLRNQLLLRDSDRVCMAHSMELRGSFVDARLLRELGLVIGRFHRFPNKRLLAYAPLTTLPHEIISCPKAGFGIGNPVQLWLVDAGKDVFGNFSSRDLAYEMAGAQ